MPKPKPEMLGAGMARKAGEAMGNRQMYMAYAEDAQGRGEKPLPYEDWVKRMRKQPVMDSTLLGG